jgi:hypothetical protein
MLIAVNTSLRRNCRNFCVLYGGMKEKYLRVRFIQSYFHFVHLIHNAVSVRRKTSIYESRHSKDPAFI